MTETSGDDGRWTVLRVLSWTAERFTQEEIAAARLEAEVLLAHCLEVDRLRLYLDFDKPLARTELASVRKAVRRRLGGEPVAYIIGHREFWSMEFEVGPAVLIPRPETERLVEVALEIASERQVASLVDVGTGSGAVAVALASELSGAEILGTDLEPSALETARRNTTRHGAAIELYRGDLLEALPEGKTVDLVVSNPPYIRSGELGQLQPEVARWEPRSALDGGPDGLTVIRRLAETAPGHISPGGSLALEIGSTQGEEVRRILERRGFTDVRAHKDLSRLDRVVSGVRP